VPLYPGSCSWPQAGSGGSAGPPSLGSRCRKKSCTEEARTSARAMHRILISRGGLYPNALVRGRAPTLGGLGPCAPSRPRRPGNGPSASRSAGTPRAVALPSRPNLPLHLLREAHVQQPLLHKCTWELREVAGARLQNRAHGVQQHVRDLVICLTRNASL